MPKWKMQSLQFRQAMRANQPVSHEEYGGSGPNFSKDFAPSQTYQDPSYKQCPNCQRRFNEDAAERHFPVCAKKAKENQMKNKSTRGSTVQNSTSQSRSTKVSSSTLTNYGGTQRGFKKANY